MACFVSFSSIYCQKNHELCFNAGKLNLESHLQCNHQNSESHQRSSVYQLCHFYLEGQLPIIDSKTYQNKNEVFGP